MSDTELAQFIVQNRTSDGDFDLPIHDWDNLSRDERDHLAERLNAQNRALAQSPTAHCRPLDLDQIDARLREVSSDSHRTPSRDRSLKARRSRSTTPAFDDEGFRKDLETDAYNELVKDGGRPLYPIDLLNEIFQKPEEHDELLRPWKLGWWTGYPWKSVSLMDEPDQIFQRQLVRWQDFRKWQNDNRDLENDDGEYRAHVEFQKRLFQLRVKRTDGSHRSRWHEGTLAQMENDPSYFESTWELAQGNRDAQRCRCRESRGGNGFAGYVEAVKRRLARHGFARPFQLKEDPKQQDKLTEWIEYLNFEYWWLDWYTATIERLRPAHDKAWQELMDLKVVRPGETMESIRTTAASMQRSREQNRAGEALERARLKAKAAYTSTQLDPNRESIPQPERRRRLQVATRELAEAQRLWDSIYKQNERVTDFIRGTLGFVNAKKDFSRHGILVQWVLDQVPLVKAELARSEAEKLRPTKAKRVTKRRLDLVDDDTGQRSLKQQRLDNEHLARPAATVRASAESAERAYRLNLAVPRSPRTEETGAASLSPPARPPRRDQAGGRAQTRRKGDQAVGMIGRRGSRIEKPTPRDRTSKRSRILHGLEDSARLDGKACMRGGHALRWNAAREVADRQKRADGHVPGSLLAR